ncbi:MAG: hypothetical protein KGI50_06255 [Patescibacteria group bacterium]|nr:hypothetical protein [Patescibacteria group bacterium]
MKHIFGAMSALVIFAGQALAAEDFEAVSPSLKIASKPDVAVKADKANKSEKIKKAASMAGKIAIKTTSMTAKLTGAAVSGFAAGFGPASAASSAYYRQPYQQYSQPSIDWQTKNQLNNIQMDVNRLNNSLEIDRLNRL